MMWLFTALSLIGVVANIHKRRWCFGVWPVSNSAWCIYDFNIGAYAQSTLFLVYTGLSIWGLVKWKKP